mmetsp:Transcript_19400/g.22958  ORF Transcript_19400/g.22958 Transcript_19400/m.22958 type:complete len:80 (-) Transcript_19400:77-316(-)
MALDGDAGEEVDDVESEDGKPLVNKISFWSDRTLMNKLQWIVYKAVRFHFVVCYFYYYPLMLLFANAFGSFRLAKINEE